MDFQLSHEHQIPGRGTYTSKPRRSEAEETEGLNFQTVSGDDTLEEIRQKENRNGSLKVLKKKQGG